MNEDDRSDVKPIFPLFPSAGFTPSTSASTQRTESLDWLENASFSTQAVSTVIELQKKVAEYEAQQNQADSSRKAPPEDIQRPIEKKLKMLRKESEMAKKEESKAIKKEEKGHSKKRTKKSKHKHKNKNKGEGQREIVPTEDSFSFPPGKIFLEEIPGLLSEHAYRIDRKRDKLLWTYSSLCKSHIATFRHLTRLCLGSTADNKIFVDNNFKKSKQTNSSSQDRYFSKKNRKFVWSTGVTLSATDSSKDENCFINSHIRLCESGNVPGVSAKGGENVDPFGIMDKSTRLYVQGKGATESEDDDDDNDDIISTSGFQMSDILQKVGIYNRRLRESPRDVDLWLEFIKFQDHVFEKLHTQDNKTPKTEFISSSKAAIEKKLSIFDKALQANPSSLELKVARLKLSEDVAMPGEVDKAWDDLLFVHAGNVRVWRYYLLHHQSKLSGFSVSRMTKLYHKCLKTLIMVMEGRLHSADVSDNLQDGMIDIFVQYCYFLHQAGHIEKAVASFQALIEFNIFLPPSLKNSSTDDKATVFESFWDSSVPRFGEGGARGWAKWMEEKSMSNIATPVISEDTLELEEEIISQQLPKCDTWLRIETLRESFHWLPWRPDVSKNETEEDCEDLDRLVLADDVTPVLFSVVGPDPHFRLMVEFVQFLGLNVRQAVLARGTLSQSSEYGQFLMDKLHAVSSDMRMETGIQVDSTWIPPPSLHTFLQQVLKQGSQVVVDSHQQTCLTLLKIHLECVRHGTPLRELSKHGCKELRKFVKNVLKEPHCRNNLVIWNAYAKMEWQMGKRKDAVGVLETALGMFSQNCADDQYAGLCSLYQTYCDIILGFSPERTLVIGVKDTSTFESARDLALSTLSFLAEGSQMKPGCSADISGSRVLKIRKHFQEKYSKLMENFQTTANVKAADLVLQHLSCMATFDLCAIGTDSALSLFDETAGVCRSLEEMDKEHQPLVRLLREEILHRKLSLMQNVFSTRVMSLDKLRSVLNSNLEQFPDSPLFLDCLVVVESRSHISGRLRRHFDKALSRMGSPVPVIFAILSEMLRQHYVQAQLQDGSSYVKDVTVVSETGIVHRVRSLFERGLEHKAAEHCPLLWRMYIQFEVKYGSTERAKGIFYRSLQQCPWAKVLYKDAVSVFGAEQLQEVVDLMTEKEIRIQIPVEEVDLLMASEPAAALQGESDDGIMLDDDAQSGDGVKSDDGVKQNDGLESGDGVKSDDGVKQNDGLESGDGVKSDDGVK
ncbi:nuclear exosome regulator NRDE2-like [Gigantopelta aegis]|uniref:nuclear exosome regulator NRDE2-like n=1 Tax=Gigantopelta aegis TaxID=1735272 RepID=UPI001B889D29|nr:nuclear exosome regulator NRDE2-like [Gigantopelta aegis]